MPYGGDLALLNNSCSCEVIHTQLSLFCLLNGTGRQELSHLVKHSLQFSYRNKILHLVFTHKWVGWCRVQSLVHVARTQNAVTAVNFCGSKVKLLEETSCQQREDIHSSSSPNTSSLFWTEVSTIKAALTRKLMSPRRMHLLKTPCSF